MQTNVSYFISFYCLFFLTKLDLANDVLLELNVQPAGCTSFFYIRARHTLFQWRPGGRMDSTVDLGAVA
jgi:hypothetical protein